MPFICYEEKNFRPESYERIDAANLIIEEFQGQGFTLTLRQLYYQFVARGLLGNSQRNYSNLGRLMTEGRMGGLVDWEAIEDRTRHLESLPSWYSPASILYQDAREFRRDRWTDQDFRVEIWIEKEALAGVFEPVCRNLEVPFFCCRGYPSKSEMWRAAMRLVEAAESDGQQAVILHFGDHDPSGMDMTRDIEHQMETFGADLILERLALNMDQVEEFKPPPNPAKLTDTRSKKYIRRYGRQSWELDALSPPVLSALVEESVLGYRDEEVWAKSVARDEADRDTLRWVSKNWETVSSLKDGAR